MSKPIPLSLPNVGLREATAAFLAVRSGWLTQFGREVHRMEKNLNSFYSVESEKVLETTTTSNGTTALHLALLSIGIKEGDEVIIPNLCYIAVPNAILYCAATPVVVDVSKDSWNIDPSQIKTAISSKTKAIVIVDNYGAPANVAKIREYIPAHVQIIHDCAESFPPSQARSGIGGADLVTLSCYANKILTAGEGGAVIGNAAAIERIRILKNQAQNPKQKFSHSELGYNFRLTNVQAAIFNVQWSKRQQLLKKRTKVFERYISELNKSKITWKSNLIENSTPWLFTISIENPIVDMHKVIEIMKQGGIESRPGFTTITNTEYLSSKIKAVGTLENSNKLSQSLISLPTYPDLTRKKIRRVIETLEFAIESSAKN